MSAVAALRAAACGSRAAPFKYVGDTADLPEVCDLRTVVDLAMSDEALQGGAAAGLDTSAAMLRAESGNLDATLHALVTRLSSIPGLEITVSRRHGTLRRLIGDLPYVNDLHRSSDPVESIQVAVGPSTYRLHSRGGAIECDREITSIERGPVREAMPFPAWATTLFEDISQQNFANHESMVALRHLVEQDRVQ
jgi:hypothetical protein